MSNVEIIATESMLRGINEEVYTFQEWKKRGYTVRKGEKAAFQTQVWKATKSKKDENTVKMIMVTGSFFKASQVEKIK